jgi:hypothetical protein
MRGTCRASWHHLVLLLVLLVSKSALSNAFLPNLHRHDGTISQSELASQPQRQTHGAACTYAHPGYLYAPDCANNHGVSMTLSPLNARRLSNQKFAQV